MCSQVECIRSQVECMQGELVTCTCENFGRQLNFENQTDVKFAKLNDCEINIIDLL